MLLAAHDAAAQQSGAAQAMLEEVVVTARRREESLQDLPLSIAAMTADQMQVQGVETIEDASDFVPNVTLTTSDRANQNRIVIRGIGGGHPDPVFAFGSGMYIDGHYVPNSLGGFMSTMDIQRIEVLRGPQGTLFGKNVTGGAVNIISAKPGPEFDSSLTLRAAEDGEQDVRGMINFPISDNVFARFGAAKETFDGYYYNRNLDIDTGGEDMTAVNAALRFTPGENWTIDANVLFRENRDDDKGIQCNDFDGSAPQWGGGTGHVNRIYEGALDDYKAACNADAAVGPFVNSSDHITFSNVDEEAIFTTVNWDSSGPVGPMDTLTVRLNASFREIEYNYLQDRDANFFAIDTIGLRAESGTGSINRTYGGELLFEGDVNDRLELTAGVNLFYERAFDGTDKCRNAFDASGAAEDPTVVATCPLDGTSFSLLPLPRENPGGPGPFMSNKSVWNDSIGVFAHATYALNDDWDLDLGVRWTEDDRRFNNIEWASQGCTINDDPRERSVGNTSGPTGFCEQTAPMTFTTVVEEGFFNAAHDTFDAVTPMVSLTRNLAPGDVIDSGMVYFLYSEGFLTGGFNTEINSQLPAIGPLLSYEPEEVANYEVGFKGTLFGGTTQIMADIFYMDYQNRQDSIDIANPDGRFGIDDPLGVVQNVSQVDITGIEFELRSSPWDGGFVSVDFGYINNEYGEYRFPNPTGEGDVDLSDRLINDLTPDWTLNVGIEHEFVLANGASLTPRLNVYASDDIEYMDRLKTEPPTPCNQDAYTKVGVRLGYQPAQGNWRAALIGRNVTDELIYEMCTDSRSVYRYRYERPAYWGLEFNARWGASVN